MFLPGQPSEDFIRDYLARQAEQPFSYEFVGCTLDGPPPRNGWNIDRHRVLLGRGEQVFSRARAAIESWRMFPRELATIYWPIPPREGAAVAVLYRSAPFRLWMLMAARVIRVLDRMQEREGRTIQQFGFAYGTLPDHPERGEERFVVEWDHRDDSVWYEILAVSQPRHWLARLGYPYTRYEQARFRRLSGEAMQEACRVGCAHHHSAA